MRNRWLGDLPASRRKEGRGGQAKSDGGPDEMPLIGAICTRSCRVIRRVGRRFVTGGPFVACDQDVLARRDGGVPCYYLSGGHDSSGE